MAVILRVPFQPIVNNCPRPSPCDRRTVYGLDTAQARGDLRAREGYGSSPRAGDRAPRSIQHGSQSRHASRNLDDAKVARASLRV
jgi:hypothetical protein